MKIGWIGMRLPGYRNAASVLMSMKRYQTGFIEDYIIGDEEYQLKLATGEIPQETEHSEDLTKKPVEEESEAAGDFSDSDPLPF